MTLPVLEEELIQTIIKSIKDESDDFYRGVIQKVYDALAKKEDATVVEIEKPEVPVPKVVDYPQVVNLEYVRGVAIKGKLKGPGMFNPPNENKKPKKKEGKKDVKKLIQASFCYYSKPTTYNQVLGYSDFTYAGFQGSARSIVLGAVKKYLQDQPAQEGTQEEVDLPTWTAFKKKTVSHRGKMMKQDQVMCEQLESESDPSRIHVARAEKQWAVRYILVQTLNNTKKLIKKSKLSAIEEIERLEAKADIALGGDSDEGSSDEENSPASEVVVEEVVRENVADEEEVVLEDDYMNFDQEVSDEEVVPDPSLMMEDTDDEQPSSTMYALETITVQKKRKRGYFSDSEDDNGSNSDDESQSSNVAIDEDDVPSSTLNSAAVVNEHR